MPHDLFPRPGGLVTIMRALLVTPMMLPRREASRSGFAACVMLVCIAGLGLLPGVSRGGDCVDYDK